MWITRSTVSARARSAFPSETIIFKKSQKSAKKDVQNRGPRAVFFISSENEGGLAPLFGQMGVKNGGARILILIENQ